MSKNKYPIFNSIYLAVLSCFISNQTIASVNQENKYLQKLEKSIYEVFNISQKKNLQQPWLPHKIQTQITTGTVVRVENLKRNFILVLASSIENNQYLYAKSYPESTKIDLKVFHVDWELNLALLEAKSKTTLLPFDLEKNLRKHSELTIVEDKKNHALSLDKSKIFDIEFLKMNTSYYSFPHFHVKSSSKGFASGAPVCIGEKLGGIVVGRNENGLFVLPASIIASYLSSFNAKQYKRRGVLSLNMESNKNPYWREINKINDSYGVVITQINSNSFFKDQVKPNDVAVRINNKKIDADGMIHSLAWGKVPVSALLALKNEGETVQIEVNRQGKRLKFTNKLTAADSSRFLIPHSKHDQKTPEHLIFSGLVFQELTYDYLQSYGGNWWNKVDSLFLYKFENDNRYERNNRLVFLNKVLVDEFNASYSQYQRIFLKKVNNVPVHNLKDLNERLKFPLVVEGQRYAKFEFSHSHGSILLNYASIAQSNQNMQTKYGISSKQSLFSL